MSESSPEVKQPPDQQAAPKVPPVAQKMVPVEAVAKEREQKRAATDELAKVQAELQQVKEQNPQFDMNALLDTMAQASAQHAREAVAEALKPVEEEKRKWKTAAALGLNEAQADQVAALMSKYDGLSDKDALALAQSQKPDLFPQTAVAAPRRAFGGMPVGGDSPIRSQPEKVDFVAKMNAASAEVAKGNVQFQVEATHWAKEEFLRRARDVFNNRPRT